MSGKHFFEEIKKDLTERGVLGKVNNIPCQICERPRIVYIDENGQKVGICETPWCEERGIVNGGE